MSKVVFKMSDVISLSEDFTQKFSVLANLGVGEKLVIYKNNLHKDGNYSFLQPFTRWWDNQNRIDIVTHLQADLETYLNFLDFVRGAHYSTKCSPIDRTKLYEIYLDHLKVIGDISKGLHNMRHTYESSPGVVRCITEMIKNITNISKIN